MKNLEPVTLLREYSNLIPTELAKESLKTAIDNRRFEIEIYWKRATYFWTLLAAVFVGYFALQTVDTQAAALASFVVSCIGLVFSLAWYLINRASAFWHVNWDSHVEQIEDSVIGSLHKTTIDSTAFRRRDITMPYRLSGTRVHAVVSFYVVFVWVFLLFHSFFTYLQVGEPFPFFNIIVIFLITGFFLLLLLWKTEAHKSKNVKAFVTKRPVLHDDDIRTVDDHGQES
ncbi:MAG: hypothetical protein KJ927_10975 [Candidatus Eisenbacteria bacterium]|nr:hypothetical protein [Candidatus Eisenbacteria bacterium]